MSDHNIAGPLMLSIRPSEPGSEDYVSCYVANTANPKERDLLAAVMRLSLESDPELWEDLKKAFYAHVARMSADAMGVKADQLVRKDFPGGFNVGDKEPT